MSIDPGAQEARVLTRDCILSSQSSKLSTKLKLREGWWKIEIGVAEAFGYVCKQLVYRANANDSEHLCPLRFSVWEIGVRKYVIHWF